MTQPPYPTLNLHLLGCPAQMKQAGIFHCKSRELPAVQLGPNRPPPLECSFEEVYTRLNELDGMFTEPDGSFVRIGDPRTETWQIDGMLYDQAERVQWCEIKGCCPLTAWHQLLHCFDWPNQPLIAHLIHDQCFVAIDDLDILWT